MENNKMTELELKIDKWLENEQFVHLPTNE